MADSNDFQKIQNRKKSLNIQKTLSDKRILIVDNDDRVVDSLFTLLRRNHYAATSVKNSVEALECLDTESFGMLICDVRLPGVNGIETVKFMRHTCKLNENRNIPVIFMTGYYDVDIMKEAKGLGLLDCIYKPFDDFQILQTLRIHLGSCV